MVELIFVEWTAIHHRQVRRGSKTPRSADTSYRIGVALYQGQFADQCREQGKKVRTHGLEAIRVRHGSSNHVRGGS
jgi:hypothetical protein